jgi:hypothetical protein
MAADRRQLVDCPGRIDSTTAACSRMAARLRSQDGTELRYRYRWDSPLVSDGSRDQAQECIRVTNRHQFLLYGRRSSPCRADVLGACSSPGELRTASVYPISLFNASYTPKSQLNTVHASVVSDASGVDVQ